MIRLYIPPKIKNHYRTIIQEKEQKSKKILFRKIKKFNDNFINMFNYLEYQFI